jgi:hypothetical protein
MYIYEYIIIGGSGSAVINDNPESGILCMNICMYICI